MVMCADYQSVFEKQRDIAGVVVSDVIFLLKYLKGGRRAFSPNGLPEIWVDVTDGVPDKNEFKYRVSHELWHKKCERKGRKYLNNEVLAILAGYSDFVLHL